MVNLLNFSDEIACDTQVINVTNLSVNRSGSEIIKDINFSVSCGEFIGIVGPNGGGKTTLLLTMLGVLKHKTGKIEIYNSEPMSKKVIGRIGWVPQTATNLPKNLRITVRELINLGTLKRETFFQSKQENKKITDKLIQDLGLENVADKMILSLSGGQRQRAVIGKALASKADIIIMDEPLVGVDRESRNSILRLLDDLCHNENKTILMVSHDLSTIRQTVHRMIYIEETIKFDGATSEFPELSNLAELRGIEPTHEKPYIINLKPAQSDLAPITFNLGKEGN
ncbi:MAG: hypothetical protein CMB56_003975 [Methanobacteriota archaeon]|nr:MAG: hypothetical protein CMB56_003975 [Euryarchaeota archaeon]|tara:strand:+ start:37 stop:885 length:849 start_codon:yes stop_codon:yes gene_type:complete